MIWLEPCIQLPHPSNGKLNSNVLQVLLLYFQYFIIGVFNTKNNRLYYKSKNNELTKPRIRKWNDSEWDTHSKLWLQYNTYSTKNDSDSYNELNKSLDKD